jgi:hypothetical protein
MMLPLCSWFFCWFCALLTAPTTVPDRGPTPAAAPSASEAQRASGSAEGGKEPASAHLPRRSIPEHAVAATSQTRPVSAVPRAELANAASSAQPPSASAPVATPAESRAAAPSPKLAAAETAAAAPVGSAAVESYTVTSEHLFFPAQIDGREYRLEAMLYRPAVEGRRPLVVFSHGRAGMYPARDPNTVNWYSEICRALASEGCVVAYIVRRGYGSSDGPDSELQDTAVASAAFTASGGAATLLMLPPYGTNGHNVVGSPELYLGPVNDFFAAIGFGTEAYTPPAIGQITGADAVALGGTAALSATVTGFPTPTLRWRKDGLDLADCGGVTGTTSATLRLEPAVAADAGSYRLVASNVAGTAVSAPVAIQFPPTAPFVTAQPRRWRRVLGLERVRPDCARHGGEPALVCPPGWLGR